MYEADFSDWNLSGDLKLSYEFTRDVLGYATYARSFKTGGITLNGVPSDSVGNPILSTATVDPEEVNSYELGLKTQFFNRSATLNIAAFWTDVNDFQTTVTNNAVGVLGTPIAISVAQQLGAPVEPFVLAVLYGANMSYLTPVGYQTNLLVMSAGGYHFSDFLRVGVPLQLIMWLGISIVLPIVYGL